MELKIYKHFLFLIQISAIVAELKIEEPKVNEKLILSQVFEDVNEEPLNFSRKARAPPKSKAENLKMPPIPKPANESLNVYIGFYMESLGGFETVRMTYDMDIFFLTSWKDPSLAHDQDLKVINDKHSLPYIWNPDLYFANARQGVFQYATVPNFVMYIYPDGTIAFSIRITLNVACNLELHYYPMDTQTCSLKIMSYAYTWDEMIVARSNNAGRSLLTHHIPQRFLFLLPHILAYLYGIRALVTYCSCIFN